MEIMFPVGFEKHGW